MQGQTDLEDLQRQVVTNNRMNLALGTGIQTDSRQGSRDGSDPGSRGSPTRKPTASQPPMTIFLPDNFLK